MRSPPEPRNESTAGAWGTQAQVIREGAVCRSVGRLIHTELSAEAEVRAEICRLRAPRRWCQNLLDMVPGAVDAAWRPPSEWAAGRGYRRSRSAVFVVATDASGDVVIERSARPVAGS